MKSTRADKIRDLLSSARPFTTGEILTTLKGAGITRGYIHQALRDLRTVGSLEEMADPSHKLRKLYRLKSTCCTA